LHFVSYRLVTFRFWQMWPQIQVTSNSPFNQDFSSPFAARRKEYMLHFLPLFKNFHSSAFWYCPMLYPKEEKEIHSRATGSPRPRKDFAPSYDAALIHQYSVASFATVRVLNWLHSLILRRSCHKVIRLRCDLEAWYLVMTTIYHTKMKIADNLRSISKIQSSWIEITLTEAFGLNDRWRYQNTV
jgi:hypothetical protein